MFAGMPAELRPCSLVLARRMSRREEIERRVRPKVRVRRLNKEEGQDMWFFFESRDVRAEPEDCLAGV